ncbi:DEAD/DEAH box helicase [Rhodococcus oxybenzonivorans]|uniref:DEAD/DEAH box helicase n=1 Tax=Rhodococcus oxybenzonivorans TaxID=1990687 RepID=UPI0029539B6E|nr:DEAD/DEAH box helicase [Rhodococcus oxybenzonivorans]MDV7353368.1 DEAD/DEAH box helicase [Rhodococcus oxybenzonivorans]
MLHGLWTPGSGLMLWVEDRDLVAEESAADAVGRVLQRKFRHHVKVPMPAASGPELVEWPAVALAPPDAAEFLLAVSPWDSRISGDLRYLAHTVRGIERWARAGRVVPEAHRAEGTWWPRWRLLGGERQRAWLTELTVAMPPVQRHGSGARSVLDDLVTELTDPITRHVLGHRPLDGRRSHPPHPFLAALVHGDSYDEGTPQLSGSLDRWRDSLTVDEPELVLRLLEPDDADVEGDWDPDTALWRLEVCLRPEGEAPVPIPLHHTDASRLQIGVRKLTEAVAAYPRLQDVPSDPDSLDLFLPTAVVIDLVGHGAVALKEKGISLLLPRAWSVASPSMRLRVSSPGTPASAENRSVGKDQLVQYDWELALGDTVLSAAEMTRLVNSKSDLVRLRGEWVRADSEVLARAARYVTERQGSGDRAIVDLIKDLIADDLSRLPVDEVTASGWAAALLEGDVQPEQVPVPDRLDATLRPYQQRGLDWLAFMSRLGLGAVLADDMGLGKTLQLLALLAHENAPSPTLLVCPMSVVGNWQREAARFVPTLLVHVHHGPQRLTGEELMAAVGASDLVITTYALLARDLAQLKEQQWRRVVLDEAQHIKNSKTSQARAARSIPAAHRVALTGTPVENRLDELRSILDFANSGILGSEAMFRKRFVVPIEREQDETAVARLRAVTSPFVLRRVKTDPAVIADLPDKFEMTVRANLTAEQAALYRAVVDDMMAQIKDKKGMKRKGAVLAALTKLKQVCNHPAHFLRDGSAVTRRGQHRSGKLGLVEDILDSVLADGEKALLFTQFREFGDLVAPYLSERFGTAVPFLHGGVTKQKRDDMVAAFQGDGGPPIMLLSLKAGGTGLNLTAANHVVHLDRWWNPAVENQATDRAFRIGQRRDVQVRKLVCVGTLEERIDAMIATKQELADLAVGTGENWVTEMSTEQLGELLRLGDEAVGE